MMTMKEGLKNEILSHGWKNPEKLLWGERVNGDVYGATLRLPNGRVVYYSGPFSSSRFENQMVIYRFD
jgi:hypothetical protein